MHWTGIANRWNTMCANCHSTNLRKNFDSAEASYDTRWSEIDVACEACHGPASLHVEWAKSGADPSAAVGFTRKLGDDRDAHWAMNPDTGIASRVPPLTDDAEIEMCSGCHSRRSLIDEEADGSRFLDRYVPALLNEGLYYADGQIEDEVYVYGSFVQSKMYHAGVRCGDCHEPHSLALRESGNDLCAQCHAPSVFAVRSHHQHSEASSGASCVECHMPSRTYMVVDDRRDHSFRIPRPDLSIELGSPNACNGCHSDRDATWAAAEIAKWPKGKTAMPVHYGQALGAGRSGAAGGQERLLELAANAEAPAIARASAVSLLSGYSGVALIEAIRLSAADAEPLMRLAAIRAADALPVDERTALVGRLLLDQVRAVRIEAARSLAGADPGRLGTHLSRALGPALAEYRHAQELDADRPNAHVNLALLELSMGRPVEAEAKYKEALEVGSYFLPAYANYADLLRGLGRDEEGERLLRRGLEFEPDSADLHHALGLALVRLGRDADASVALRRAAELTPENVRYAYVFAVALYSGGEVEPALDVLRAAHENHPSDLEILQALASIGREAGHDEEALGYLRKLQALTQSRPDQLPPRSGARSRTAQ
jgi:predicted CXXCH cytochrome family protein